MIISIIIPTYNRFAYLRRAVESCLNNQTDDTEVIVVDDGSEDCTRDWLSSVSNSRVRIILQSHQGAQVARNRGLKEAKGKFIRFLDSDDWLAPEVNARQIASLCDSGADVAYGDILSVHEGKEEGTFLRLSTGPVNDMVAHLLGGKWVPPHSYLYRRESLAGIEWREGLRACQDFDFVLSVAISGASFEYVDGHTGYYLQHDGYRVSRRSHRDWCKAKLDILSRSTKVLSDKEELTPERKASLTRSAARLLQNLVSSDDDAFKQCLALIGKINPEGYLPEQRGRRILARFLGLDLTERVIYLRRQLKTSVRQHEGSAK